MLVSFLSSPVLLLVLWVFGTAFLPLSDWNHSVSSTYLANCRHQVQVHWYRHTSNLSWTVKIQNILRMFQMDMSAIYHISTWINCHRMIYILKGICTKTVFQKYFDFYNTNILPLMQIPLFLSLKRKHYCFLLNYVSHNCLDQVHLSIVIEKNEN